MRPGAKKTPESEEKNEFSGGRGKNKREILGPPPFWAPPFGAPLFLGLGPHPEKPPPFGASQFGDPPSADSLAKSGVGLSGAGLNRLNRLA